MSRAIVLVMMLLLVAVGSPEASGPEQPPSGTWTCERFVSAVDITNRPHESESVPAPSVTTPPEEGTVGNDPLRLAQYYPEEIRCCCRDGLGRVCCWIEKVTPLQEPCRGLMTGGCFCAGR